MDEYDRVLINPSRADFERALQSAAESANHRARSRKLPTPFAGSDFLAKVEREPEGWRQWVGDGGRVRSGEACSLALVAWWSDRLGRKHYHIIAHRGSFSPAGRINVLSVGEERPPLWLVYPENVYLRQRGDRSELFAVCACGAAGPPEALGWAGPCCGPCHDRREAGEGPPVSAGLTDRPLLVSGHLKDVTGLAFSSTGRQLVSRGRADGVAPVYGLSGAEPTGWWHPGWIGELAYSPDGKLLAIGGNWGTVDLLDAEGLTAPRELPAPDGAVQALAFSPDGKELAVSTGRSYYGAPGITRFWDVATGESRGHLGSEPVRARCLAYSPDGQFLAAALRDQYLAIFDTSSGEMRREIYAGRPNHMWLISSLAYAPDGQWLAAVDDQGDVHVWESPDASGEYRAIRKTGGTTLAFSPDGRVLAVAGWRGLRFFAPADGRELAAYTWHGEATTALAFAPDGQWLATGGPDRLIKLWPWTVMLGA
jgi:hypothetical protein